MPWGWSHSSEAYDAAYENVQKLKKTTLLSILREWACHDREEAGKKWSFRLTFNGNRSRKAELADLVWQRAEEQALCSSDGYDVWLCPDGCHTVPFRSVHPGGNEAMDRKQGHDWSLDRLNSWLEAEDTKLAKRFDKLCEARVRELCRKLRPALRIDSISVYSWYYPVGEDVLVRDEDGYTSRWNLWDLASHSNDYRAKLDFVGLVPEYVAPLEELFTLLELWHERGYGYSRHKHLDIENLAVEP